MDKEEIRGLLERYRQGGATLEESVEALAKLPYENIGFAQIDHHRELRQGFPEVIYAEGKTKEQTKAIFLRLLSESAKSVMATRISAEAAAFVREDAPEAVYDETARILYVRREAEAVDAEAIVRLFASPLGKRMLAAPTLRREFKFSLLVDAERIYGCAPGEQLLLQGVVDCFLEEDGEITVIDYKTDRLKSRAAARERAKVYAGQLSAYAYALTRICQKPVKECLLHFLSVGETVAVPLEKTEK